MKPQENIVKKFFTGVISVGFGSVSISVLGLLGSIVAVRYLPVEVYGIFILLQIIGRFMMQISDFGLSLAIPKFIASEQDVDRQTSLVNSIIVLRVLLLILASVFAYFGREALTYLFSDTSFVDYIAVLPVLIFSFGLHKLFLGILQGLFKFGAMGATDAIASSMNFILIVVLIAFSGLGIWGMVIARVVSLLFASLVAYLFIALPKRIEFHSKMVIPMIRFSLPLYTNDILTFVFSRADTILIATMLGPTEIALYEVARKIPENAILAYDAFRGVFFPFVARFRITGENHKIARLINNSLRWLVFLGVTGVLGAFLFGQDIFSLIFPEQYIASVPSFIVLTLSLCFLVVDYTLGYSLVAIGESDKPMYINIFRTIIIIICDIVLIQSMNILGAAFANLLGFVLATPMNFYFLSRKDIPVDSMLVWKPLVILVGIVAVTIFFGVNSFLEKSFILILYIVISLTLSVVAIKDISAIIQGLRQQNSLN
jgi:PST family polysaccharide transporter